MGRRAGYFIFYPATEKLPALKLLRVGVTSEMGFPAEPYLGFQDWGDEGKKLCGLRVVHAFLGDPVKIHLH